MYNVVISRGQVWIFLRTWKTPSSLFEMSTRNSNSALCDPFCLNTQNTVSELYDHIYYGSTKHRFRPVRPIFVPTINTVSHP